MSGIQESQKSESAQNVIVPIGIGKRCISCGEIKKEDDFYIDKTMASGLRSSCKKCMNSQSVINRRLKKEYYNMKAKEWAKINKKIRKEKRDRYRIENRGKIILQASKWRNKNKPRTIIYGKRSHEKRKEDPMYRLNAAIRSGMCFSLRGKKNGTKWEHLVGYGINELKKHLEGLFTTGITWENYGSYWHVDHIIPISAFNYEKPEDIDFMRCWSLSNLRPLEAKKNLSKNNKIDGQFQPALLLKTCGLKRKIE